MKKLILIFLALLLLLTALSCNTPKLPQSESSDVEGESLYESSNNGTSSSEPLASSQISSPPETPRPEFPPYPDSTSIPLDLTEPIGQIGYEVAIGEGLELCNEGTNSWIEWIDEYEDQSAPKQQEIEIDGIVYDLIYRYSVARCDEQPKRHVYESNDKKIMCHYLENGAVYRLIIKDFIVPFFNTENELVEWSKNYLSQYGADNLDDDYEYSCRTMLDTSGPWWVSGQYYYYFIPVSDFPERHNGYEVNFTRYIDGYPTTDEYTLDISYPTQDHNSRSLYICIDKGNFKDVDTLNIDKEKAENSIKAFVIDNLSDDYTLEDFEIDRQVIAIIDDRFCLSYDCGAMVGGKKGGFALLLEFFVFLE